MANVTPNQMFSVVNMEQHALNSRSPCSLSHLTHKFNASSTSREMTFEVAPGTRPPIRRTQSLKAANLSFIQCQLHPSIHPSILMCPFFRCEIWVHGLLPLKLIGIHHLRQSIHPRSSYLDTLHSWEVLHYVLHRIWYLLSLTIWSYVVLYIFIMVLMFLQIASILSSRA